MDAAVAEERRGFESRNHPKDPLLLRDPQPSLETDEIPHLPGSILPPELDHCMRLPSGSRIGQTHRLHGSEPKRLPAPASHLLHWEAALEVGDLIEFVAVELVGLYQSRDETLVGFEVERRIEIVIALTLAVARQSVEPVQME